MESSVSRDQLPNMENPDELGRFVTGSWRFDSLELTLLSDEGDLITEPTTLYTDEVGTVIFADGSGVLEVQFQGGMVWYDDGTVATYRKVWSSNGELDLDSVVWGEWEPMAEKLQMDTDDFFARAYVTALSADEMFLDWDDEDPVFDDGSCIYSIDLSRVDDAEFSWIANE